MSTMAEALISKNHKCFFTKKMYFNKKNKVLLKIIKNIMLNWRRKSLLNFNTNIVSSLVDR